MSPSSSSSDRPGSAPGGGSSARARLAAERLQKEQRRRRLLLVVVPVAVVLVAVVALVAVRLTGIGRSPAPVAAAAPDDAVVSAVTSVPKSVLDQIGAGSVTALPKAITAPALTAGGKPRVLYVGAEYCPYCAAERWAMVVALSRFGTFTALGQTASAADDVYPSTPTLSFHGSSFTGQQVAFTGVETEGNTKVSGGYAPLDNLSTADQQVFSTYDAAPYVDSSGAGSIPFVDIGGRYLISGASYNPQLLAGKTHQQVASALAQPSSPIAQAVDGTANVITAAICATTKNAPSSVCSSAGVVAAAKRLS